MLVNPTLAFVLVTAVGVAGALVTTRARSSLGYALWKGVASLGFVSTALASGAMHAGWSTVALVALVLCAAGDLALAVPAKGAFIAGLACFAVAHAVFAAAFVVYGANGVVLGATAALAVAIAAVAWILVRRRVPESMCVAVGVYIAIVSAMLALGTAAGITHRAWLLAIGVLLVFGSDAAVARERFGTRAFANKLIGLPTYYVGQTLIAFSLAGP